MKIILAPDKFKGSLTAAEAAAAMARGCRQVFPEAQLIERPLADGGEGSLEILRAVLPLRTQRLTVCGPLRRPVAATYLLGAQKAYIEVAEACGLAHVPPHRRDPGYTTTIGVGELIDDALARGAREVYLFLGGSATHDGGAGMAGALGYRFYSDKGHDFIPSGNSLRYVSRVDAEQCLPALAGARFVGVCDVDNPLLGPQGAAAVYAAQKGALPADIPVLEEGMAHFAGLLEAFSEVPLRGVAGAGAAGGLGAACLALLRGTLQSGITVVLTATGFTDLLKEADLVLTGEGKIDGQTARGKVVHGVAAAARAADVPVIALAGARTIGREALPNLTALHSLLDQPELSAARAQQEAAPLLEALTASVVADFFASRNNRLKSK